jgi:hypothetical protein
MDENGKLLLLDIMDMKLKEKKAIVRAFLTSHYRKSVITTSENLLNSWIQGYVLGRTRLLCHGVS